MTTHETRVHMIRQHLEAVQDLAESARLEAMKARNAATDAAIHAIDIHGTTPATRGANAIVDNASDNERARQSELEHIERIAEALRVAGYVI